MWDLQPSIGLPPSLGKCTLDCGEAAWNDNHHLISIVYILPAGIVYADSGKPWPSFNFQCLKCNVGAMETFLEISFLKRLVTIGAMSGLLIAEFKGCLAKGTEGL